MKVSPEQAAINCPTGLEYLLYIDQIQIKRQNSDDHVLYKVFNCNNEEIYLVNEDLSDRSSCCSHLRQFDMTVRDYNGSTVAHLKRPYKFDICCFNLCPFSLQELKVSDQNGQNLGRLKQLTGCHVRFDIDNEDKNTVLKMDGFVLTTVDGKEIGNVTGKYENDKKSWSIKFPLDLNGECKLLLLGALVLYVSRTSNKT